MVAFLAHQTISVPTSSFNLIKRGDNQEMNNNLGQPNAQDLNRRDGNNREQEGTFNEKRSEDVLQKRSILIQRSGPVIEEDCGSQPASQPTTRL